MENKNIVSDAVIRVRGLKKDFDDLVAISDKFDFHFYNAGLMHKGNIYTFKKQNKSKRLLRKSICSNDSIS